MERTPKRMLAAVAGAAERAAAAAAQRRLVPLAFSGAPSLLSARARHLSSSSSTASSASAKTREEKADEAGFSAAPKASEKIVGSAEKMTFQAETKQLLNIVTNSLYTDKHVFVRELVSNASDALEKLRHLQASGAGVREASTPLCIRIATDEAAGTLTFSDTGLGMDRTELVENLGTIARSGSKAFLAKLKEASEAGGAGGGGAGGAVGSSATQSNIIGQFGVGFYSAFMVAESVTVYSQGYGPDAAAHCWTSSGDGSYEIAPASGVPRGTKIVLRLKDTCRDFASAATVRDIVTRYSNFVNFPIYLNDKQVNTVAALWNLPKADVTEEAYAEFYKFKSGDFEAPLYRLHFSSDAPTHIKALLFVGQSHDEKYGMGRLKPGTDLYSRRVLIQAGSPILPDWLRFCHGVVDSEDVPLNISRESMQDSALMKRLRSVLTRRVLRFLDGEARRDPERFSTKFFPEFGQFLKEGAVTDQAYAPDIARLLRFESSFFPAGTFTSFDEYVSRMPPGQTSVYYIVAPSRALAEASPYMEAFRKGGAKKAAAPAPPAADADPDAPAQPQPPQPTEASEGDVEVLFLYSHLDDFVMNNLREVNGRKLVTAETAELDPSALQGVANLGSKDGAAKGQEGAKGQGGGAEAAAAAAAAAAAGSAPARLTDAQVAELSTWWVNALPARVAKVRATTRLRSSPAVVTDHESASLRRMMRMVEASAGKDTEGGLKFESQMLPKQTLEVNPAHPVIVRLHSVRDSQPLLAKAAAEQVLDNALIAAGLLDDARTMLPRLNALLEQVMGVGAGEGGAAAAAEAAAASAKTQTQAQAQTPQDGVARGVAGYPGADALGAKRWVSPKEKEEREALAFSEELYAEVDKEIRKNKAAGGAAAGSEGEEAEGGRTGGRGRSPRMK